jgi:L-alanine-DL-glutamate epimerase-like enolase superfamily enzyme
MKITSATIYPLCIPLIEPIKMSREMVVDAKTVLLCLTDEEGRQGWGEASVAPLMTGETLDSLVGSVKFLLEQAKSWEWTEPKNFSRDFAKILYGNASAKSCFEMALLDLFTQKQSLPLWRYLRQENNLPDVGDPAPIPLLRMLGGSFDKELADAKSFRSLGFRHWKIKIGSLSLAEDLQRVEILSNLLEGDVISVDANGAMSLADAIQFCESKEASKLSFAEQLIAADLSIDDFVLLKKRSPIPIGLDESIHGVDEIEEFIKAKALDGASLKLIKTGGVLPAFEGATVLRDRGCQMNLACKIAETSLSGAATAAIGFAIGNVPWGFSMSNQYLQFDICDQPLVAKQGHLDASQLSANGIGVIPNTDRVKSAIAKGHTVIQC